MTLRPGYALAIAAKFHMDANWAERIEIGAGLEENGGACFPRGPWRPPTADELAILAPSSGPHATPSTGQLLTLGGVAASAITTPTDALYLFQIPEHLRAVWWDLLDAAVEADGPMSGFDTFAAQVSDFLAFKRAALPASVRMEAVVTAIGEQSIRRDPTSGRPAGLGSSVSPSARWPRDDTAVPHLRAIVNLGDEQTAIVLINLPPLGLAEELTHLPGIESPPGTVGALVDRFFRARSDYPPVRVRLGPGEGCFVPAAGLVFDGDPTGKEDPDVLLLISANG
jgi:hypothetical protein